MFDPEPTATNIFLAILGEDYGTRPNVHRGRADSAIVFRRSARLQIAVVIRKANPLRARRPRITIAGPVREDKRPDHKAA